MDFAVNYMTKEDKERLEGQLGELKSKRKVLSDRIGRARELGDLSENAEYHAAKEDQGHNERKIRDIEEKLSTAVVVGPNQAVFVNCRDVRRLLEKNDPAVRIDGYVRLESNAPLTVDGVYSALTRRPDGRTEDTSLDVERIRGRLLRSTVGSDLERIDAP